MAWIQVDRFSYDGVAFTFNVPSDFRTTASSNGVDFRGDSAGGTLDVPAPEGPPVTVAWRIEAGSQKLTLEFPEKEWQRIKKVHEPMVEKIVQAVGSHDRGFMD